MADELPSLHIDTDWKKQAQEEKRKLTEQAAANAKESAPPASVGVAAPATSAAPRRARGETPSATFAAVIQSTMTQVLYYLGEMAVRGAEPVINFDMARHHLDILGILETKTANNLDADEKKLLDTALYETRMRFVSVVSQYIA